MVHCSADVDTARSVRMVSSAVVTTSRSSATMDEATDAATRTQVRLDDRRVRGGAGTAASPTSGSGRAAMRDVMVRQISEQRPTNRVTDR
jgi:hypothetical protein